MKLLKVMYKIPKQKCFGRLIAKVKYFIINLTHRTIDLKF